MGMQRLLHVHEPDYGHLFENMLLLEREPCLVSGLIQPKVEGELSFCLGKSLQGPGITVADVYDATEWVTPSIEIVDSRIKDWKIRLPDTIADNGSSARFMLGGRMMPIGAVDMRLTGMTLEQNGVLVSSGTRRRCGATQRPLWHGWPTSWGNSASPSRRAPSSWQVR